jgi:hypothetical protein
VSGILGLMEASTMNPNLLQDQNFLTTMREVLPQGPGMNGAQQPLTDANGNPIAQPGAQQQPLTDANGNPIAQPGSQQQPLTDANGNPIAQPGANVPQQFAQPQYSQQMGVPPGAPLTDTTNNPASADPQIQQAILKAFQLIQSGDQFDGARLLMMIAKADPAILQDKVFIQNLQITEQAAIALKAQSDAAMQGSGAPQQQLDAQGNPIAPQTDAQGNPIAQPNAQGLIAQPGAQGSIAQPGAQPALTDANGNPIAQPGTQQVMTGANGNPIAQPGTQQVMTDANGNPIAQPGTQQVMTGANGNPIAQPGTQQVMTDANGNPIAQPGTQQVMTDANGNPITQTQAQPQVTMAPSSLGAPTP